MPLDSESMHYFDYNLSKIQFLIQRLANIGIDIECLTSVSTLDEIYNDIKERLLPRIEKYGFYIFHCEKERDGLKNCISITIMK